MHRKRRRQHGSTYVEALIVIGLFTFLWAFGLAVGRLYTAKLASVYKARTEAWLATSGAADSCDGPRDSLGRSLDALSRSPDASNAPAVLDAASKLRTRGAARTGVMHAGTLAALTGQDGAHTVETTTRFACNETAARSGGAPQLTTQRWLSQLLHGAKP